MARAFALLFFAGAALALSGCATDREDDPNHVSTIPWNRPEKWESQGPLGGMMPENR